MINYTLLPKHQRKAVDEFLAENVKGFTDNNFLRMKDSNKITIRGDFDCHEILLAYKYPCITWWK